VRQIYFKRGEYVWGAQKYNQLNNNSENFRGARLLLGGGLRHQTYSPTPLKIFLPQQDMFSSCGPGWECEETLRRSNSRELKGQTTDKEWESQKRHVNSLPGSQRR